jgi:hypothetical protein
LAIQAIDPRATYEDVVVRATHEPVATVLAEEQCVQLVATRLYHLDLVRRLIQRSYRERTPRRARALGQ